MKQRYLAYPENNCNPAIAKIVYVNPKIISAFPSSANDANNVIIIFLNDSIDEIVLNGLNTLNERNEFNYIPEF